MVETDWRQILSLSQKELSQSEKENLCESLSWMEADDIELNFSDMKTLFRLSQDILKYKNEQVNNLLGQLETMHRKSGRKKLTKTKAYNESPTQSADAVMETITHQEEVIKANKGIIEQLYADIEELEEKRARLVKEPDSRKDLDSDSSRDPLSEMAAVDQLQEQLVMKNKHIRKLLNDIKASEEENSNLKSKTSILKEKLSEATQVIEKLTHQLSTLNSECSKLKETLGKTQENKSQFHIQIDSLKQQISEIESDKNAAVDSLRNKLQHWKSVVRSKKAENEALTDENIKLKKNMNPSKPSSIVPKEDQSHEQHLKLLQEKLLDATKDINDSAQVIEFLKKENRMLKAHAEETPGSFATSNMKTEIDEEKETVLTNKFKKMVNSLTKNLRESEDIITLKEKELMEVRSELHTFRSGREGIASLVDGLKSKDKQLKLKDDGIKSLVQEINTLNQLVNDLQLENETMRQKLNISPDAKISVKGILKKFSNIESTALETRKKLLKLDNNYIELKVQKRKCDVMIKKLKSKLKEMGCSEDSVNVIINDEEDQNSSDEEHGTNINQTADILTGEMPLSTNEAEMQTIAEENEGLRKGLQEILDFLKDHNASSMGSLALQCPSLEAVLRSMEARHAAGWFAPHMAVALELRAALGGRDALLVALNDARKATLDVMTQLELESQKYLELEGKLRDIESKVKEMDDHTSDDTEFNCGVFGTWMAQNDISNLNVMDQDEIKNAVVNKNLFYESQLKNGLVYFHKKFKFLYQKFNEMVVQAADDRNKWSIQEENYKAEIETMKTNLRQHDEEDRSDNSPGIIEYYPDCNSLQRKCAYLEESYRYIRTLNENMKNELLDCKRDAMVSTAEYENKVQTLILRVATLTDKLRSSISLDIFLKQNEILQNLNTKHRQLLEQQTANDIQYSDLHQKLEQDRIDVINTFQREINKYTTMKVDEKTAHSVQVNFIQQQLETVCKALDEAKTKIKNLETVNGNMQMAQNKLMDNSISTLTKDEIDQLNDQLHNVTIENNALKEQCLHVGSQLDIALLQLQDHQQKQMNTDLEINILRHQVLDLQSVGDNKAIIARLSGEILISHLQASENHKKIERLHCSIKKEKQSRIEAEEVLKSREKIFDIYASRYESKFKYMFETMNALRQQYHGSLPFYSLNKYIDDIEDLSRKNRAVDEKLNEVEDLQTLIAAKHSVFDELLEVTKLKCLMEDDKCPHHLQKIVNEGIHSREINHYNKKIDVLEQSRRELISRSSSLEKTLILVNQNFNKLPLNKVLEQNESSSSKEIPDLELEDIHSDEEQSSRRSQTITLPKPLVLKAPKNDVYMTKNTHLNDAPNTLLPGSPVKLELPKPRSPVKTSNVFIQTISTDTLKVHKFVQTERDKLVHDLKQNICTIQKDNEDKSKELSRTLASVTQHVDEIIQLKTTANELQTKIKDLQEINLSKSNIIIKLQNTITELNAQFVSFQNAEKNKSIEENKNLLQTLKNLESNKHKVIEEYKEMLKKEREAYANNMKDFQKKIFDLQMQLNRNSSESSNPETVKEIVSKYNVKIVELEDKNFKLQSDLDTCRTEISSYQSELERWKTLACDRLNKMEQLKEQLEQRHSHEVESYKAETQHWVSQLNGTQREHADLRSKLNEQRVAHDKQMADKDAHIEQLRAAINNLKSQVINMQTLMSVNDPSFDLSAIIEVDENSDGLLQSGSDALEIKFDSTLDLHDFQDEGLTRMPSTSTAIWQEPLVERLRREKQLIGKQNAILRRQIKALAGRERRARLEAQNLQNQVYRISTSGSKAASAESAALHNKIGALQAQLDNARKDSHTSVALWDKWKRAQQAAERWQARCEEQGRELKKLDTSVAFTRAALVRLEREKRALMTKLGRANAKLEDREVQYDRAEEEEPEKALCEASESEKGARGGFAAVSVRALVDRVEAQQRRIVALELAERGNEPLVSEYEKALAEITALKGQVLKLESSLLESQIRSPMVSTPDQQPEKEYWKSYCDMLKEENMQLTLKLSSMEVSSPSAAHHRVGDLEQTVLTLRGLVSKLQAEQRSSRRGDSAHTEKNKTQVESYRTELSNLKRSITGKDLLLERSKEMLKIAAEREEKLLQENAYLRHQLNEMSKSKQGFLSA